ncbi:hypothetical protein F5Y12DRAFT_91916 [Xylaria sp. FL1777]|nr:hypothetical protein F5Y12DRAFT_91916 [Xylaria sp. FL1777]
MTDQDMRLRLVVRRNGLPELRLMWHVHLDTNPTISKLLEQLNDLVPLESDHWGLEDYAVELRDSDGTSFECLHYQLVQRVLKPDDRVFIRALDRDDHRRRRISGRHQVSSDGRHLIDGVPFGRPHLKTTAGRPNIYIPPLKRPRLAYTQQDGDDDDRGYEVDGHSPVGLITDGELHEDDDSDSNADDANFTNHDAESNSLSSSTNRSRIEEDEDKEGEGTDVENDEYASENGEDEDLAQEVLDLAAENTALEGDDPPMVQPTGLDTLDKLTALRVAFPAAPIDICEKVLLASKGNLKTTYNVLSDGFSPYMSQEAVIAWRPGNSVPYGDLEESQTPITSSSTNGITSRPLARKRKFQEQSSVDDSNNDEYEANNNSLWRKYDHAGFPPGTITSGKGLAHMAAISTSFENSKSNCNSEARFTTPKAPTIQLVEEEEDTSDSRSSFNSSTSSDESDHANDKGSPSGHSSSLSGSVSSSDSYSENNDELSEVSKRSMAHDVHSSSDSTSESATSDSDSDSDSDSGPEERSSKVNSYGNPTAKDKESYDSSESSDSSSESESTEADSSSESERDAHDESLSNRILTAKETKTSQTVPQPSTFSPKPTEAIPAPILVPPGAGKESTKRRNARRRAAKLAKRKMQEPRVSDTIDTTTEFVPIGDGNHDAHTNGTALFEAKRKALLDAIATSSIEIRSLGEKSLDHDFIEIDRVKRKHAEEGDASPQTDENEAVVETTNKSSDDSNASVSQKRRRIDLGAGRRLVFGALGLRTPKNKDDENKLRDQLQANAQLRTNRQIGSRPRPTPDEVVSINDEQDPDAWKLKINYRAVECYQDNIELSPAPFPFQQRWDPQQQYPTDSKNKRGCQSKRAQRNHNQYYGANHLDKKRKHHHSYESVDGTYDGEDDTTNGFDVTLNYDDVENEIPIHENDVANETSQDTDLDDLPSLPKDVSVLPILRPEKAQVGMVITWLKWTCSSATGWQPQLSRVAAIVVKVDDDTAALEVCLAKRDRYLDENEKRYDHRTGQRIYNRFEAPDLREEDELNDDNDDAGMYEGYRNIPWADMQDPRILQQPLDLTAGFGSNSKCIGSVAIGNETTIRTEDQAESIAPLISSHQEQDHIASLERARSLDPGRATSEEGFPVSETPRSISLPEKGPRDSSVKSCVKATGNSTFHQARQDQQATGLTMSDTSEISSPSRQLHETTSQAMSSNSPIRNWGTASSIELGASPRADNSSFMPPAISCQSHLEEDFGSDIITGTPEAVLVHAAVSSPADGVHSGRQFDYTMDVDNHVLTSEATNDIDHQDHDHVYNTPPPARSPFTPIVTGQTATPDHNDNPVDDKAKGSSPSTSSTSRSLPSLNQLWCTALTSHSIQSPSRVDESSIIPKPNALSVSPNAKYQDAMRKLNEQFDDPSSPTPANNSLKVKREDSTQFQARTLETISPPPRRRPFTIPPSAHVVELSSDSEPTYTESYADDEIDGTYTPRSDSLPRGAGWVKKQRNVRGQKARKSVI